MGETRVVLFCRSCGAPLTGALRELAADDWRAQEWRVHDTKSPLVDIDRVLIWSNDLWSEETMFLPFSTDCFVIEPDALIVTGWVSSVAGCCGFPPLPPVNGQSPRNQGCVCGELIGWHNTDCLLPQFVALSQASVRSSGT